MQPEKIAKVQSVFHGALSHAGKPERDAYLDGACGTDQAVRERVDALLAAHDQAGGYLEPAAPITPAEPVQEGPGTKIGPYKILQRIGEGGMGVVYMAEQEYPVRRKVALKIIKLGMDTKEVIARFEAERQALALMDHVNISRVLDAGATDTGRPFFVMELVRGISIDEYCDKNNLSTRERLRLFIPVCRAVQHAHQKGIIHRDIKPQNVLVTLHDGKPVPKVIDFGIAKATNQRLTEKTLFTEFRQFIGTPAYMSPEQAEMSGLDVDTRTDIYSLGVLMYELLTGVTPFDAKTLREAGYMELQRIIREDDPPNLSTRISSMGEELEGVAKNRRTEAGALGRLFRGDLDWIVMMALEKDRTRRYESASNLADDVARFLDDMPVRASPPSTRYRLRKFVRRNRVAVMAGGLIAAALLIGCSVAIFGLVQARKEADRSQKIADFLQDMLASTDPVQSDLDVEQVVQTAREVFGEDHATVAATLSSRALQLQSAGDMGAAEQLYRKSLDLWKQLYGENHVNVGTTLGKLGGTLLIKGDDLGAEDALRESLRITSGLPDGGGVARSVTLHELSAVLLNRGAFDEAAERLAEAIRIRRAVTPNQKLAIAVLVSAHTDALFMGGKRDKVPGALDETVAAWRAALPEGGSILAKVFVQVGSLFRQLNEPEKAEALLREAVGMLADAPKRSMGAHLLKSAVNKLGAMLKPDEFMTLMREVVGEQHSNFPRVLGEYARYLEKRERPFDALTFDLAALAANERLKADVEQIRESRASIWRVAWKIAAGPNFPVAYHEAALAAVDRILVGEPQRTGFHCARAALQYRLGRHEDALETLEQAAKTREETNEVCVASELAFLAMTHQQLRHADAARDALQRLRDLEQFREHGRDQTNQPSHRHRIEAAFLAETERLIGDTTPRYTYGEYDKALKTINWKDAGHAVSKIGPLLVQLADAVANEKPYVQIAGEASSYDAVLVRIAGAAQEGGVPGSGPNGSLTHPAVQTNLVHATLKEAGMPLDEAQEDGLKQIGNKFVVEDVRRLAGYDEQTLGAQKLIDELDLKDRFYAAVVQLVTDRQREILHAQAVRGRVGFDLFSTGLVYVQYITPLKYQTQEDLEAMLVDSAMRRFAVAANQKSIVAAAVGDWARSFPEDFLTATPDSLDLKGRPRLARVRAAAGPSLAFYQSLLDRLPADSKARPKIRDMTTIVLPVRESAD